MAMDDSNSSLLIGRQHIRLNRVNSTNKYALECISKSKPIEGTVISASFQYEGRGQIGRFWESEAGKNITCSTIIKPIFLSAANQFNLNIAVSLAVFDLVDHFLPDQNLEVKIKWPNDIYVNNEKIAGILIQNSLKGKNISSSILGTGININQRIFSADIPNPTSLINLLKHEIDLEVAFSWLFRFMSKRYLQLSSGHHDQLRTEYLQELYRKDIWSSFHSEGGTIFKGKILGIDDIGRLKIQKEDNQIYKYSYREIKFII